MNQGEREFVFTNTCYLVCGVAVLRNGVDVVEQVRYRGEKGRRGDDPRGVHGSL